MTRGLRGALLLVAYVGVACARVPAESAALQVVDQPSAPSTTWLPDTPAPDEYESPPQLAVDKAIQEVECQLLEGEQVFYEFGKATISPKSFEVIDRLAALMRGNPGWVVEIGTHTDSQGSDKFNMNLSQKRADAVRNALIQRGVEPERIRAVGFGETHPIDTNRTAESRARNRRTEFIRKDGPCAAGSAPLRD